MASGVNFNSVTVRDDDFSAVTLEQGSSLVDESQNQCDDSFLITNELCNLGLEASDLQKGVWAYSQNQEKDVAWALSLLQSNEEVLQQAPRSVIEDALLLLHQKRDEAGENDQAKMELSLLKASPLVRLYPDLSDRMQIFLDVHQAKLFLPESALWFYRDIVTNTENNLSRRIAAIDGLVSLVLSAEGRNLGRVEDADFVTGVLMKTLRRLLDEPDLVFFEDVLMRYTAMKEWQSIIYKNQQGRSDIVSLSFPLQYAYSDSNVIGQVDYALLALATITKHELSKKFVGKS